MAINAQEIQGQWNTLRGQVKEKWGQLTDDDLQVQGGDIDQLVGRIQQKTGEGRESIEGFLTDLTSKGSSKVAQVAEVAGAYVQKAGDRLRDQYGDIASQARDQYGVAADKAREHYGQAQDHVRHNPGQSVVAAFGVGLAMGVMFGLVLRSK